MRHHFRDWALRLTLALAAIWLVAATPARADTTYLFTGDCYDCNQTHDLQGYGALTLTGYTPGDAIQLSNFVSFSYDSNLVSYSFTSGELVAVSGGLASDLPSGLSDLFLSLQHGSDPQVTFLSNVEYWSIGVGQPADFGYSGSWDVATTAVPEPASLALLGAGLAGLVIARRPRRR